MLALVTLNPGRLLYLQCKKDVAAGLYQLSLWDPVVEPTPGYIQGYDMDFAGADRVLRKLIVFLQTCAWREEGALS